MVVCIVVVFNLFFSRLCVPPLFFHLFFHLSSTLSLFKVPYLLLHVLLVLCLSVFLSICSHIPPIEKCSILPFFHHSVRLCSCHFIIDSLHSTNTPSIVPPFIQSSIPESFCCFADLFFCHSVHLLLRLSIP